MSDDEKITIKELKEWIDRGRGSLSNYVILNAGDAEKVFEDIKSHREVLEDGGIYRSATGTVYKWDESQGVFLRFGMRSSTGKDSPQRPLEKIG